MDRDEFEKSARVVRRQYIAICNTHRRHWVGELKDSYEEAFEEADRHRYADGGRNRFHDIQIVEEVSLAARLNIP